MSDNAAYLDVNHVEKVLSAVLFEFGVVDQDSGEPTKCQNDAINSVILMLDDLEALKPRKQALPELMPDDCLAARIDEIGNQVRNLGCDYQNNEDLSERLGAIAADLWALAKKAPIEPVAHHKGQEPGRIAPEWDGEGLPPIGTECERHIGEDVYKVEVVGYHEGTVVVFQHDASPDYTDVHPGYLKPIRSQAERDRDDLAEVLGNCVKMRTTFGEMASAIIAAGWHKAK